MRKSRSSVFHYRTPENNRLFFIAGPCVIESEFLTLRIAERLAKQSERHQVDIIFKASYDKANRTAGTSFRGVGLKKGMAILKKIKQCTGLPLITDIHEIAEIEAVAAVVDVVQIPAFLCRQTSLLKAAAKSGCVVNIKKGQFMAPLDMEYAVAKAGGKAWVTERGTFFGYHRLVVDFTGIIALKEIGLTTIFDATHSIQEPGGGHGCSAGQRSLALPLAKAAIGVGVDGLFFEVHPNPDKALCDGPNSLKLTEFEQQIPQLLSLHNVVKTLQ